MRTGMQTIRQANYGLDAPAVVRNLFLGGAGALAAGLAGLLWGLQRSQGWLAGVGIYLLLVSASFGVTGAWMIWSSYVGKLRLRDRLLDDLRLKGNERVLDVGCGHGLLLIGAAKRLPGGRAVGIDLWSQRDQASNSKAATLANAVAEGVEERVEVQDGDMRDLPFSDASFDAVVASLAVHNIPSRDGRRQAINEMVRVLKPGGQVALLDFSKTDEYAHDLQAAGMRQVRSSGRSYLMCPPVRIVTAVKPPAAS